MGQQALLNLPCLESSRGHSDLLGYLPGDLEEQVVSDGALLRCHREKSWRTKSEVGGLPSLGERGKGLLCDVPMCCSSLCVQLLMCRRVKWKRERRVKWRRAAVLASTMRLTSVALVVSVFRG